MLIKALDLVNAPHPALCATLSRRERDKGPSLNRESPLPPGEGQGEGLFKSERNFVVEIAARAFAATG